MLPLSDGTRLHYDLHGPASSPNKVLLIMGLLTDGAAWALQTAYFASRGFQCVSYDNRGVARSSSPGWTQLLSYSTKRMAQDALELVNALGWERFHVVGVSMGGMISMELALAAPQRIRSLTLAVTHAGGWGSLAPWSGVRRMAVSMFTKDEKRRLRALMAMLYSKATLNDAKLARELEGYHIERIKTRIPPKFPAMLGHTLAVYRHYVPYNKLLHLRYAAFPTQVMVGTEDQLVQMGNSHMLARVLGAKLVVIPNGGHGMFAEHPQLINEKLEEFFLAAQDSAATEAARRARDASSSSPDNEDAEAEVEDAAQCMGEDGEDGAQSSPFSLEERALQLACAHSTHCTLHSVAGFLGAFLPAFVFRYVFFSSIALDASSPSLPRLEQAVRFGLLIGALRGAWRALRCVIHAYRARRWVVKHGLVTEGGALKDGANAAEQRRGIPRHTGFGFPFHSVAVLVGFAAVLWQQKLLHGIFATAQ